MFSHSFRLIRDRRGVYSGEQEMWCKKELFLDLVPDVGAPHPDYEFVVLDTLSVRGEEGGVVTMTGTYVGAPELDSGEGTTNTEPEYGLDISLSEEPIETHERYTTGLTAAEIQEAVTLARNPKTDEDNKPVEPNPPLTGLQGELFDYIRGGVEAVREPRQTWTQSSFGLALEEVDKIGEIDTPPGGAPTPFGRNWLFTGMRARRVGGGAFWDMERTWELSAKGGWIDELYGNP